MKNENVPPGFGDGQKWRLRTIAFTVAPDEHLTVCIARGTAVHEKLHGYYWAERESYRGLLAAAKKANWKMSAYMLVDDSGKIVGAGSVSSDGGPDDIAWISCMFAEMKDWRMACAVPRDRDVDLGNVANAKFATKPRSRLRDS